VRPGRYLAGDFQNEFAADGAKKILEAARGDVKGPPATDHIVAEELGEPVSFEGQDGQTVDGYALGDDVITPMAAIPFRSGPSPEISITRRVPSYTLPRMDSAP